MKRVPKHTASIILITGFVMISAVNCKAQVLNKKQEDRFAGTYLGEANARVVSMTDGKAHEKKWEEYLLEITSTGEEAYTVKLHVSWSAHKTTRSNLEFPAQTHTVSELGLSAPYTINGGDASFYGSCADILLVGMVDKNQVALSFNGCRVKKND